MRSGRERLTGAASVPSPIGAWVGTMWDLPVAAAQDAARRVEAAGYTTIWISEAFGRDPFAFAALLLAVTDRLTVATGIANVWARDPAAMVAGACTLEEAFPGRVVLGVGISHARLVDRRGHAYASPLDTMEAYLRAMSTTRYEGPTPGQLPPVVVGALDERMLALSGRLADGAHPYLVTVDHSVQARKQLGPGPVLAPEQPVAVVDDPALARAAARRHLATYLGLDNYVRSLHRQGFSPQDLADGGSDRLLDALVAWGDEQAVTGRVRAHLQAGADHVAVQPIKGEGLPDPVVQLERLAPALGLTSTAVFSDPLAHITRSVGDAGVRGVDHIGIAVKSIPAALRLFGDVLGATFVLGGDDPVYGIRTVQFNLPPGVKIELMMPIRADSYLHGYLNQRGEGLHHLTLFVQDIARTLSALDAARFEVVDTQTDDPKWRVTYVRPTSGFGTLLQIAETEVQWYRPLPGITLERVLAGDVVWYEERPTLREDLPPGADPGI